MRTRTAAVIALLAVLATTAAAGAQPVEPPGDPTPVPRLATEVTRPDQATPAPPTETYVPTVPATAPATSAPAVATTPAPAAPVDLDRPILRVVRTHVDPNPLAPGQAFVWEDVELDVLDLPGSGRRALGFHWKAEGLLFSGDTLRAGGFLVNFFDCERSYGGYTGYRELLASLRAGARAPSGATPF